MDRNIIFRQVGAIPLVYYESVTTWDMLTTEITIGTPSVKSNYVDIPYGDGSIDLTQAMTGEINYSNRKITLGFDLFDAPEDRQNKIDEIMANLHGRLFDVILPDSPNWLYRSRITVNSVKTSMYLNKLTMTLETEPYRLKPDDTVVDVTVTADEQSIICHNDRKPVVPFIKTDKDIVIKFGSKTFNLGAGTQRALGIKFVLGDNELKISGTVGAKVTITYREGSL